MGIKAERSGGWWRPALWGGAALALLAPLVAMWLSDQVAWTTFDFAVLGGLLLLLVGGVEVALRASSSPNYRIGAACALGLTVLLALINGAVGIIGDEDLAANRLYLAVPAVAFAGALIARFRPAGMAHAMAAAAAAQIGVPAVAGVAGAGALAWAPEVVAFTAAFAAGWLVAGRQFRKAATSGDAGLCPRSQEFR